ncbi:hypothetical protein VDIAB_220106 [Vibrio diabolicus]|nr:hypothetical protein VDIAB_220106 [Vibrio diabolicus]
MMERYSARLTFCLAGVFLYGVYTISFFIQRPHFPNQSKA